MSDYTEFTQEQPEDLSRWGEALEDLAHFLSDASVRADDPTLEARLEDASDRSAVLTDIYERDDVPDTSAYVKWSRAINNVADECNSEPYRFEH